MKNKIKLFIFVCLGHTLLFAQGKTSEIGIISDNDLYTSSKNDMFYTNGLELFYRFATKNDHPKINKKITELKIGQYIYNPRFINKEAVTINNRPFAGYLFAKAGRNYFYQSESVLKTDVQFGLLGPNGLGKEMQESFHHVIGYKEVFGWENQIHNALGFQAHVLYSKKIFQKQATDFIDFHWQSEANVGTIFTGASTGFMSRIGFKKLLPLYDSNMHDASVSYAVQQNIREFYFYMLPTVNYQQYDATIQGSMFSHTSPITFDLIPWRFNAEFGLKYRHNNFNLSYSFNYRGKELKSHDMTGSFYGSIRLGYLLR